MGVSSMGGGGEMGPVYKDKARKGRANQTRSQRLSEAPLRDFQQGHDIGFVLYSALLGRGLPYRFGGT